MAAEAFAAKMDDFDLLAPISANLRSRKPRQGWDHFGPPYVATQVDYGGAYLIAIRPLLISCYHFNLIAAARAGDATTYPAVVRFLESWARESPVVFGLFSSIA